MEEEYNWSFQAALRRDGTRNCPGQQPHDRMLVVLLWLVRNNQLDQQNQTESYHSVITISARPATPRYKIMPLSFTKAQFDAWVSTLKRVKDPHSLERKNACYYVGYCYWYDDTTRVTGERGRKRSHATKHVWGPLIDKVEREAREENYHDQLGKHYFRMGFAYLPRGDPISPVLFSKAHPRLLVESEKEDYEAGSNYESTYLLAKCYLDGYGVEENADLAFRYFLKAAKNGHVDAQVELSDWRKWGGLVGLHDAYEWISEAISNEERNRSSARTLRILRSKAMRILDIFSTSEKRIKFLSRIQRRRNLLLLQEKKLIVREGDRRDEISAIASTDTEDYAAIRGGPIIGEKIAFGEQHYHSDTSSRGGGSIQKDNVGKMEYPLNLFPHIVTRLVRNGFHCRSSIELRLLHSRLAEGWSSERPSRSFRQWSLCSPLMCLLLEFVVPRLESPPTNLINKAVKRKDSGNSEECVRNAMALPPVAWAITGGLPLPKRQRLETQEEKLRTLCNNGDGGRKTEVASVLGTLQSELQIDELSGIDFWLKGGVTMVARLMELHLADRSIQFQGIALFLKVATITLKNERQKAFFFNEQATSVIVVALQSMKHHSLVIRIQQCGWTLLRIVLTRYYKHTNLRVLCRKVAKFATQCLLLMNQCTLITESIGAIMWHFCRDDFCRNWFVEIAGAGDALQKVKEADIASEHKAALNLLFSRLTQYYSCDQHTNINDIQCPFQFK